MESDSSLNPSADIASPVDLWGSFIISILPSLAVALCPHQPRFLLPRHGAQQCWKVRGEESVGNLSLFSTGLSAPWSCCSPLEGLSARPRESLALESLCNSIHHSASGSTMSTICPIKWSLWLSIAKQWKHLFLLLPVGLLTISHEMELFCFTKSKYLNLWRWWKWASTWNADNSLWLFR